MTGMNSLVFAPNMSFPQWNVPVKRMQAKWYGKSYEQLYGFT